MTIATYSPEDVIILLGGVYQIEGLYEGSFVTISEEGKRWETSVTADGRVSRTHINSPIHSVSLTLMSTASANTVFSAWASADGLLFGAMIPLMIKDSMGTSVFYAPMSWIEEVPESSFDVDVGERVWSLKTAGAVYTIGGNEGSGTDIASLGLIGADIAGLL